ncbi:hypothetical protein SCHPADRAFT_846113 [Schizopora paradoxa]|uniref:N-acetyltransferase domain-containing protein n=1 Tax=Schizopora paradoxa TaxID=27342 RepID=A0A0H2S7I4_9AGAM|nr:hypothetical protein SCHPADRAFT_846113 [Schizopora paradoxa]
MSAYGAIERSWTSRTLRSTIWKAPSRASSDEAEQFVVLFHLTLRDTEQQSRDGLVAFMHNEFADEIERGQTYPQETAPGSRYTLDAFTAYFFAADVFVGLICASDCLLQAGIDEEKIRVDAVEFLEAEVDFDSIRNGRDWGDCVAGFYYIKPNYPGRSSHNCNAGFFTSHLQRGKGFATILAKSYLHYAPQLGYKASVFNLVYANNQASIRIWDKLGFTRAGLIPKAGRLKKSDGDGEEYVDALVYYKSFE